MELENAEKNKTKFSNGLLNCIKYIKFETNVMIKIKNTYLKDVK